MTSHHAVGKRETPWTKGPWIAGSPSSVVGWPVVAAGSGRYICDMNHVRPSKIDPGVPGDRAFNAESRANAHLIAAAPCMYEALRAFADHFGPLEDNHMLNDEVRHCFALARAALSRALPEPTERKT